MNVIIVAFGFVIIVRKFQMFITKSKHDHATPRHTKKFHNIAMASTVKGTQTFCQTHGIRVLVFKT